MLITKASEYALLSLVIIHNSKKPVDVNCLSKELSISKSFLAKILQSLAKESILKSYRGANGGFSLNGDINNLSIKEVITAVEKRPPLVFECSDEKITHCEKDPENCSIRPIFINLQNKINNFLEDLTLKDVIEVK